MIERNAAALAKLVEDLLDVSRITLGHLRLDSQPLRLADLLTIATQGVQPAAQAKEIQLTVNASDPAVVSGDPTRVQQIIWNLLTNAIKFTPPRGCVEATVSSGKGEVTLTVADNGRGIDPEFLPYVFEPFRQAEKSVSRTHGPGHRSVDRPPPRRAARRYGDGRQRRPRPGQRVHRDASPCP